MIWLNYTSKLVRLRLHLSFKILFFASFDPKPDNQPIPLVPKDVLLAELLQSRKDYIFKYHEHQTLLENKEDEELNEEERKAAWEEYENEKTARVNSVSGMGEYPSICCFYIVLNFLNQLFRLH